MLFLLLAAAYTSPIFSPLRAFYSGNISKDNDWLKIAAFEHFARDSLAQGGLAFWCPYFGGGYPLIAHPKTDRFPRSSCRATSSARKSG